MRWFAALIVLASVFTNPAVSQPVPEPPTLCSALLTLADHAKASARPQLARFYGEPWTVVCSISAEDRDSQRAYCDAVLRAGFLEFKHAYPWRIYDCLTEKGMSPRLQTVDLYTGLMREGRINRLDAKLPNGVAVSVEFKPDADQGSSDSSTFKDYDGQWLLTLTP